MKTHEFTVILDRDPNESEADRLYGVIDDGSLATHAGVSQVAFHREGESLEAAIRSALDDLRGAGFTPSRVELEPDTLAPSL